MAAPEQPDAQPDGLNALVERARAALADDGAVSRAAEAAQGPFAGAAADGLARAEVDLDGRVLALVLEPALFREPLEDVTAAARHAINAALDARPADAELSPLVDVVRTAQAQARRQLDEITNGMAQVAAHVREQRERND
jgi:hypothetical protein